MFINPGQNSNHWINIILKGTRSNRIAIGARLKIVFTDKGKQRRVYRDVNSGGSFGSNPLQQHIGIGRAAIVDSLIIAWPGSRRVERFTNIPANKNIKIKEGTNTYSCYNLKKFNYDSLNNRMHFMPGTTN